MVHKGGRGSKKSKFLSTWFMNDPKSDFFGPKPFRKTKNRFRVSSYMEKLPSFVFNSLYCGCVRNSFLCNGHKKRTFPKFVGHPSLTTVKGRVEMGQMISEKSLGSSSVRGPVQREMAPRPTVGILHPGILVFEAPPVQTGVGFHSHNLRSTTNTTYEGRQTIVCKYSVSIANQISYHKINRWIFKGNFF